MQISICARDFDYAGNILVDAAIAESDLATVSRRVTRYKLLSGGVYLNDSGYYDGDRTLTVVVKAPDKSAVDTITRLVQVHGYVTVSTELGLFLGVIEKSTYRDKLTCSILLESKLSG